MLLEHGEAEICKTYSGLDEDLFITADAEAFVKWHAGQLMEATRGSRIQFDGPSWPVRAFPNLEMHAAGLCPHQARRCCYRELTQRRAVQTSCRLGRLSLRSERREKSRVTAAKRGEMARL